MPQKAIKFTGINRKVNEFHCSGECEELINLRPEVLGGHSVVKPKHATHLSVPYVKIYEHTFGDTYNQIVVADNGTILWINPKDGGTQNVTSEFSKTDIELTFAGNVMVAYSREEDKQLVFKFEKDKYESYDVTFPHITHVDIDHTFSTESYFYDVVADDATMAGLNDALAKAASGYNSKYKHGLCGTAVIGCTYELEDGNEVWSTGFLVAETDREPTFNWESSKITVFGPKTTILKLTLADTVSSNIKRINIYSTRPVYRYEYDENLELVKLPLSEVGLDGQLMYYQGSVKPDKKNISFMLKFEMDQAGERVMEITPGCIERTGNSISYNNRFHFFRSDVQHVVQQPSVSMTQDSRATVHEYWAAYVKFDDKWKQVKLAYDFLHTNINNFIYPMAGIKQMAFVKIDGDWITKYSDMFYVDMQDSSAYNYSYAFDVKPSIVSAEEFYSIIDEDGQIWGKDAPEAKVFLRNESNVINASAPYNPLVFPVEYSYNFSGEILDIATSYLPITSTQIGQYPLSVFTTAGVYAMEQGNGNVLYSNIIPLQPLVIDGKATSTPYGTFFISSKNIYVLSGSEVSNVSYVLNGERETTLRELDAYKKLCLDSRYFYDFTPFLSNKDFEDFVTGAVLTYDQLNNELLISSKDANTCYSYVFNLDTKSFHKVAKRYLRSQNGGRYAIEVSGETKNIVDMQLEVHEQNQPILLQSRPLALDALYTHIQRLILFVDTKLTTDAQNLCISVFASDNLNDWRCIISSQKKGTILRQIRTNRAAKSYKDYVILISGIVDTNTDISELIADYTAVLRRLG